MTSTPLSRLVWMLGIATMSLTACGEGTFEEEGAQDIEELSSSLTSAQRRERVTRIQGAAADAGLHNSVLLAGIANSETYLAHCWSELTWACKGPASSSCGGGPVVAGSGDGPCRNQQGGLGYFQFDAGTYSQTIARYGQDVLTVEGNTSHAVRYVIDMVKRSRYIPGVSTDNEALAWLDTVRVDGNNWDAWIKTVVHYYNGCVPGRCGVYNQRYGKYSADTRAVYREFGADFWYRAVAPAGPLDRPDSLTPEMASVSQNDFIPLSWAKVQGATNYDVAMEYSADGESWQSYHTWEDRGSNAFNVWPQFIDMNYRWKVRACRLNGCSEWSDYGRFLYGQPAAIAPEEPTQPEVPEGLQPPASMSPAGGTLSRPAVELSWSEVDGAARYDIDMQYSRNSNSWTDYYTWTGRQGTEFTVWPQADNADYRWRLRACDDSECSDWSGYESFYFNGK